MLSSDNLLYTLAACCADSVRQQSSYDEDLGSDIKSLLMYSEKHLILQSSDLIQNINNLTSGVGIPKNVVLSEVPVRRQDNHVEHHRNRSEELLQGARIRCLKKIEQQVDVFMHTFGTVSPTFLQSQFLESTDLLYLQISIVFYDILRRTTKYIN